MSKWYMYEIAYSLLFLFFALFPAVTFADCPCSIWPASTTPASDFSDGSPLELGTKFQATEDGYITALRFYKPAAALGGEIGHLWTKDGVQLASTTLLAVSGSAEPAGWYEGRLEIPIAISSSTTYIASYANVNSSGLYYYGATTHAFDGATTTNASLLGVNANGSPNGVYSLTPGTFPTQSFNAAAYFADVVFTPDVNEVVSPTILRTTPENGETDVSTNVQIHITFSEAINPSTLSPNAFTLVKDGGESTPLTVTYNSGTYVATLTGGTLESNAHYTLTVKQSGGIKDYANNELDADHIISFTTKTNFNDGAGGPILVLYDSLNGFSQYYPEILRAEGLTNFSQLSILNLNAQSINNYDVIVVGAISISSAEAAILENWVNAGGNLILMKPDSDLLNLAGVSAESTLSDAYYRIDTSRTEGRGLVDETMQYHGPAEKYSLTSAEQIAALYSDDSTDTGNAAVTLRSVGSHGGQVATFSFDVAKSIIYTRQGNPAQSGIDTNGDGVPRSNDLFEPDYLNVDKAEIPQADELQRFFVRILTSMNEDKKPLPRFWYLPHMYKVAILNTIDDHGQGDNLKNYFNSLKNVSQVGCSLSDWECFRATAWIYTHGVTLSDAEAQTFDTDGFEIGVHVESTPCKALTENEYRNSYTTQLGTFQSLYPSLPQQRTHRYHCIVMSDWSTQAEIMLEHGIRLDMNYYYWPSSWIQGRPGLINGSGFPMRYADLNGFQIDVFQEASNLVNENGLSYPSAILNLVGNATGSKEYFGILGTHTDYSDGVENLLRIVAVENNIPMVTARQVLDWTDARNNSNISSMTWVKNKLSFSVDADPRADGLSMILPLLSNGETLESIERNGIGVEYNTTTIKGVAYATWLSTDGDYDIQYSYSAPLIPTATTTETQARVPTSGGPKIELGKKNGTKDSTAEIDEVQNTTYDSNNLLKPSFIDIVLHNRTLFDEARKVGIVLPREVLEILMLSDTSTTSLLHRDLSLGMEGKDVEMLQEILIRLTSGSKSETLARIGVTGYFGTYTQAALAEYQRKNAITPSLGYFGSLTRAFMKKAQVDGVWWY